MSRLYLLFFFALFLHSVVVADEHLLFNEIVVSDMSYSALSDETDMLVAPLVLLGKKAGNIVVNARADMSIASVESKGLLIAVKQYLKTDIYQQIAHKKQDFFLIEELPKGVKISLDELLNVKINLAPSIMQNINPQMLNNQPRLRNSLTKSVNSMVNDIRLKVVDEAQQRTEFNLGVSTAFRFNRFLLTGHSRYHLRKFEIFERNLLANYEDLNKNYWFGYQHAPTFAGVSSEQLLGLSIGNTHLNNYIIFESDQRYLDLVYDANVKVYVDDSLYSDNDLRAGKHVIDMPFNIDPSLITLKVEDVYGRKKSIAFDFGGQFSSHIPKQGQVLYFASIGRNENNTNTIYAGAEFALDALSKLALSANLSADNQVLGLSHYRLFPMINLENTINFSKQNHIGVRLKTRAQIEKFNTNLILGWSKDFAINNQIQENKLDFSSNIKLKPIEQLTLNLNAKYQYQQKEAVYSISTRYQQDNLSANLSYETNGEVRFSLEWTPQKDIQIKTTTSGNHYGVETRYNLLPNRNIRAQHRDDGHTITFEDETTLFKSIIRLDKKNNTKEKLTASTQFSIVASEDKVSIAPVIDKSGFVILSAGSGIEQAIEVAYAEQKCEIHCSSDCAIKIPSERAVMLNYKLGDDISYEKIFSGIESPVLAPFQGGIVHTIDAHQVYFVQAIILHNGKVVDLLAGKLIDKNGEIIDVFTDEQGEIVAQLSAGQYQLELPGFQPQKIVIAEKDAKDGMVNLRQISVTKDQ